MLAKIEDVFAIDNVNNSLENVNILQFSFYTEMLFLYSNFYKFFVILYFMSLQVEFK